MQLVEIAKALSLDARLLILDEPTSSLTLTETDRLLRVIDDLKAEWRQRRADLAPAERGRALRRPGRGPARRPHGRRARQGGDRPRRDDPADDRPRPQGPLSAAGARTRGGRARAAGAAHRRLSRPAGRACRCAAARSWALPGWSAPAAASSPGRCSASTAGSAARSGSMARQLPSTAHATRSTAESTWYPRTASARVCCSTSRSPQNIALPDLASYARGPLRAPWRRDRERPAAAGSAGHQDAVGRDIRRQPVGRQPAEGRARQMALDAAAGGDLRRADPRRRRRRQERDLRS